MLSEHPRGVTCAEVALHNDHGVWAQLIVGYVNLDYEASVPGAQH